MGTGGFHYSSEPPAQYGFYYLREGRKRYYESEAEKRGLGLYGLWDLFHW